MLLQSFFFFGDPGRRVLHKKHFPFLYIFLFFLPASCGFSGFPIQ